MLSVLYVVLISFLVSTQIDSNLYSAGLIHPGEVIAGAEAGAGEKIENDIFAKNIIK